jgi:hypothetical protein
LTSQPKKDTRSEREIELNRHASAIWTAITDARREGFHLEIKDGWALDLVDSDGTSTPIAGIQAGED